MAHNLPDLSNLTMESLDDFLPRSSSSKTPPPETKKSPSPKKPSPINHSAPTTSASPPSNKSVAPSFEGLKRPDLANLQMGSIEEFLPVSSLSEQPSGSSSPKPRINSVPNSGRKPTYGSTLERLRSSLSGLSSRNPSPTPSSINSTGPPPAKLASPSIESRNNGTIVEKEPTLSPQKKNNQWLSPEQVAAYNNSGRTVEKKSTPPPQKNNNLWLSPGQVAAYNGRDTSSETISTPVSKTISPSREQSNNPFVSNNPWWAQSAVLSPVASDFDDSLLHRPGLERQKSYSLDLPRPSHSLVANGSNSPPLSEISAKLQPKDNSAQSVTTQEESIAAEFGLGNVAELREFAEYEIWNASLSNMRVCPKDLDGQYYYIAHRSFLPNRPGVIIHPGSEKPAESSKSEAILAVAHLDTFSTNNSLGIGNPLQPSSMTWEKLHHESFWTHMRYSFEWDVEVTRKGLTEIERHKFEWHRTKNNFIWDDQGDLVLVKQTGVSAAEVGEVLAMYEGKGPLGQFPGKQRGVLRIKPKSEAMREGWEMAVLLSWAAIVELSRRRARQRRISSIFGHI